MIFKTKFNVRDRAWFMENNKPSEVEISAIEIFFVDTNQDRITYNAKKVIGSVSWLDYTKLNESSLFKSKKELLASLFFDESVCKGANCSAVNGVGHSTECVLEHDAVVNAMEASNQ